MSKENTKTLEVYKEKAHLYLINSAEHDRIDPVKAKKKREKLDILLFFVGECLFILQKKIQKAYDTLEDNGIFMFNAINREIKNLDNEWVDFEGEYHMGAERYYNYFSKKDLNDIIEQTKFQIEDFRKEGGENNNKWLIYVLKK